MFERVSRTLRAGAIVLAAGAWVPLASAADEPIEIVAANGWISNVQYAGIFAAIENGYFADEGLAVDFIPGGPNAPDTLVSLAADRAQFATANWLPILDAVAKGNDFVIVGAQWAISPAALMSMARKPVKEPQDLVGAKILSQHTQNDIIIDSVLGKAGLPLEYETVPTGFSPEPLIAGDGDAYFAFATNQPLMMEDLGFVQGEDFHVTLLHDLGYEVKQGIIVTKRSFLEENREAVVAYLRALAKGWRWTLDNPEEATRITVEDYGADFGLDYDQQLRQVGLQEALIAPEGAELLMFDPEVVATSMTAVAEAAGREVPPVDTLVDLSPLREALDSL